MFRYRWFQKRQIFLIFLIVTWDVKINWYQERSRNAKFHQMFQKHQLCFIPFKFQPKWKKMFRWVKSWNYFEHFEVSLTFLKSSEKFKSSDVHKLVNNRNSFESVQGSLMILKTCEKFKSDVHKRRRTYRNSLKHFWIHLSLRRLRFVRWSVSVTQKVVIFFKRARLVVLFAI